MPASYFMTKAMLVARVVTPSRWLALLELFAPRREQGDTPLFRCRRYVDLTVNVQLASISDPLERDDILVHVVANSFVTPLRFEGLKTADGLPVAIDLTASWRVTDPQSLLRNRWYDRLREHGAVDCSHVAADLGREARDGLASAVASLRYADLKSQGSAAPSALEHALIAAAGPALKLADIRIGGVISKQGDAHLAAAARAHAQQQDMLAAIETTKVELARVTAEAELARARREANADLLGLASNLCDTESSRAALVRIVISRKQQAPRLIAIDHTGCFEPNVDPAGLPIAVIGRPKRYRVNSRDGGYLTLLILASSGRIHLLFPDELFWDNNTLEAGETLQVPPRGPLGPSGFDLIQRGPEGEEKLVAIVAKDELLTNTELRRIWHDEGMLSEDLIKRLIARLKDMKPATWASDMVEYLVRSHHPYLRAKPT